MQRREQLLLGALLATVVSVFGGQMLWNAVMEPLQARSDQLASLTKSIKEKDDQLLQLAKARKSITDGKESSLPPDIPVKGKRRDALNAQRLYQKWLTDLAELCEFEGAKVSPVRTTLKAGIKKGGTTEDAYVSVVVKLEANPRYSQLVRFLDQFYRTNLLHRITALHITTKEFELDPYLSTVVIEAEGLALIDAAPRATLFAQTELVAALSEDATELQVVQTQAETTTDKKTTATEKKPNPLETFPKKPGFRIRIKNEFLNVTAIDGDKWTVERGVERTRPAGYTEKTIVEHVRQFEGQSDRSIDDLREMISKNIFLKPSPPYRLKLAPLSDKPFVKGRPIEFTLTALGYDSAQGKPEFAVVGSPPPGLTVQKTGKVSWKPGADVKPDQYPLTVEVKHPSAPKGCLTETLTLRLREANAAPKLKSTSPRTVYLNRDWSYKPEITSAEVATAKFTWKLGDRPPLGLKINSTTGELNWTPGDSVPLGEMSVPLVLTDGDTPPQSTTLSMKLDIQDDAAAFTRLDIIFRVGDRKRAFLFDPSKNKKTELHEGDAFAVADLNGTVKSIGRKHIVLGLEQREIRVDVGQSLREAISNADELSVRNYE